MPATAARGQSPVSPRNPTGKLYAKQQAEAAKRKEILANPEKLAKASWHEGFDTGHRVGYEKGQDDAVSVLLSMSEDELLATRAEFLAEFGPAEDVEPGTEAV
jgi:flagellar biosynthesis/type III secretory pathway protein FliH